MGVSKGCCVNWVAPNNICSTETDTDYFQPSIDSGQPGLSKVTWNFNVLKRSKIFSDLFKEKTLFNEDVGD